MSTSPTTMRPTSTEVGPEFEPPPVPVGDELAELVRGLAPEDQYAIGKLLSRALGSGRKLDTITLVHESLKANIEELVAGEYADAQAAKAPAVIKRYPDADRVTLPAEHLSLEHRLDRVIEARASRRDFSARAMTLQELGTLLHYAYGIRRRMSAYNTRDFPLRLVPSSGSLQAIELYVVANRIDGLERGLYHFDPVDHALEVLDLGNMRRKVVGVSIMQEWLSHAGVVLFMTCVMSRAEWKYKARGYRFVHMDAGVLTGQLYLIATALKLRACAVAAFLDDAVNEFLEIDGRSEFATLMMGLGTRPELPD